MIKNKSKKIIILVISAILLLSNFSVVKAAGSFSASASKTTLTKGATTTLTIKASSCAGKFSISSSDSGVVSVSSSSEFIDNSSATVTLTAKSEGTATITVTASDVADTSENIVSGSKSVTITVNSSSNGTGTNNNNNNNNDNKPEAPTEPTFKSANETVYATGDINVRKSYSADSEKIGSLKTGESVTRTGIGDNGWSKVTYNGSTGYIKTSLLSTEEPAKSSDKALKTLEITPEGLDPEFNPETTSYTLTVEPDVEKLDIKAAPNDEKATVEITGNENLQPGDNVVKITVKAQDETTRIYNINVKKQETAELGLSSIKINGYTLSPKFSSSVYEYKLNVLDPSVTKLDISAEANDENAKVEISGNTNLQNGENTVVITVTSEDGTEKVIYQIYVNKSAMAGTTDNKDNMALYIGIGVTALVIILIIIIIVKNRKKKNGKEDESENLDDYSDLYGYSSRNPKVVENEELKSTNTENVDKSKQDIENELFGKLPNDDNIENACNTEDFNTTIKNEDKFTYNPYVTKDIYGDYDYQKDMDTEIKTNSESAYKDLYGNTNKLGDFSSSENTKAEPTYSNGISENKCDSDTSLMETSKDSESEEDYTLDDNYKIRRSKGKHSK